LGALAAVFAITLQSGRDKSGRSLQHKTENLELITLRNIKKMEYSMSLYTHKLSAAYLK
jgi:hypothetical protein